MTDNSVAYVAAVILDPSQKWQYFEEEQLNIGETVVLEWKKRVDKFYIDNYFHLEAEAKATPNVVEVETANTYIAAQQQKR